MSDELPQAEESEKVVLGSILVSPEQFDELRRLLTPDRFGLMSHRKIFTAMLQLHEQGQEITPVLICEQLNGQSQSVGGIGAITSLSFGVPQHLDLRPYIQKVVSAARKRWIVSLSARLDGMARNGETEDQILDYAASQIDTARSKLPQARRRARLMSSMLDDQAERYLKWHRGISDALPTGFPDIDEKLAGGGLVKSGLFILGAQPSMGKTAFALDVAANVAGTKKFAYIVSREMSGESLFDRIHSAATGVAKWKFRPGVWDRDYQSLISTLPTISDMSIILDDGSDCIADIRSNIKDFWRQGYETAILLTDYIQLLEAAEGRTRNDQVGNIGRGLKCLAMELEIPVLALSQLSREQAKQNREPELSDLRDSGELEAHADAVFFLFGERPEEGVKFFPRTFKCAKQRDGELFRRELMFNGELVSFRSLEQRA